MLLSDQAPPISPGQFSSREQIEFASVSLWSQGFYPLWLELLSFEQTSECNSCPAPTSLELFVSLWLFALLFHTIVRIATNANSYLFNVEVTNKLRSDCECVEYLDSSLIRRRELEKKRYSHHSCLHRPRCPPKFLRFLCPLWGSTPNPREESLLLQQQHSEINTCTSQTVCAAGGCMVLVRVVLGPAQQDSDLDQPVHWENLQKGRFLSCLDWAWCECPGLGRTVPILVCNGFNQNRYFSPRGELIAKICWTPLQNSWKCILPSPSSSNTFTTSLISCQERQTRTKYWIRAAKTWHFEKW